MSTNCSALEWKKDHVGLDPVRALKHEILNALTPVMAYSEQLEKCESDPQRRQQLRAIRRCGSTIERLVELVHKPEMFFKPRFEACAVDRILQAAVDETRPLAQLHKVGIDYQSQQAGNNKVIVDPDLIQRLLVNLLLNAVKVTPAGQSVSITASMVTGGIRLAVRDQGPGLPHGSIAHIEEGYTSKPTGLHGTGLSICRTIASLHGALLHSNNLEHGAEIFLILPNLYWQPDTKLDRDRPRVLIVDDDLMVAQAMASALSEDWSVDLAYRSEEALLLLCQNHYQAMLLDLDLGKDTGESLLDTMAQQQIPRPERVIFVTGDPMAQWREHGTHQILCKPFDTRELQRALKGKRSHIVDALPGFIRSLNMDFLEFSNAGNLIAQPC